MFAALTFDHAPLEWKDVPGRLINGIQDAGGWAAVGALLFLIYSAFRMRPEERARIPTWLSIIVIAATAAAWVCYITYGVLCWPGIKARFATTPAYVHYSKGTLLAQWLCVTVGGLCGVVAAGLPFLLGVLRLRVRRIFAIASLSFREAVRRRVLYVFSLFVLIFLFGTWFIQSKPENQVRTYVQVLYWGMAPLLLLAAVLIASFSIPTDIRNQTIHTILTKPVQRFEVVVGRFLGFTALMSVVLVGLSSLSLLYLVRGVDPEAADESLKAREPMNGELSFVNTSRSAENRGDSVGREWDYRSYITIGPPNRRPTAVWTFDAPPARVAKREHVRCEFTFDIFHTTKGVEDRGVACSFTFKTGGYDPKAVATYREDRKKEGKREDAAVLAEKYGFFEVPALNVRNHHTQTIDVPGGLFRNALESKGKASSLIVEVRCADDKQPQYVGMAKYDLYLRLDDPEGKWDQAAFAWNFLKGAVGLWFRLCVVIGLGVALSTYLSGVISMIVTGLLYFGGLCEDFIRSVATKTNIGGGPWESLYRLATRQNMNAPLDKTGTVKVAETTDQVFRWVIERVLNVIPDVDRFDLTSYVAEGFNIPGSQLLLNLLLLVMYLLPWAVLGYYLLKWREVASST
jgi:hypothetical protein